MYYVRQFKGLTFMKEHNLIRAVSKYCKNIFSRNFKGSSIRNGTSSIQMHMFWTTIINLALESMLRPRLVGNVVPVLSGRNNMEVCVTTVWRV